MQLIKISFVLLFMAILCVPAHARASGGISLQDEHVQVAGVAVSGLEYSWNQAAPSEADLDYMKARGVKFIRLAFAWERMQRLPDLALRSDQVTLIQNFLTLAHTKGIGVILDMHNYGRYNFDWWNGTDQGTSSITENYIGTTNVPISSYVDVWTKLAVAFKGYPALIGYGLMNEPHDMASFNSWKSIAQQAVNGIRYVDKKTTIYAGGYGWSAAKYWTNFSFYAGVNDDFILDDPTGNIVYEAHAYFDDNSGRYELTYDTSGATPTRGVEWVEPFVSWCNEKKVKCFLGEYGAPKNDPRWITLIENLHVYLDTNNISSAWWMYTYDDGDPTWWPLTSGGAYELNLFEYPNEEENPYWTVLQGVNE